LTARRGRWQMEVGARTRREGDGMKETASRTGRIVRRFTRFNRFPLTWGRAEKDLAYLTGALGRWHPDVVRARRTMQTWLTNEGRFTDAVRMAQEEAAARAADFGPGHADTLKARLGLAFRRGVCGDTAGAVSDMRVLVEDLTRLRGADHEDTHDARRILGQYQSRSADAFEGIRALTALCAESEALGPERHNSTRHIRATLIEALERNGQRRQALALLDEEIAIERATVYDAGHDHGEMTMWLLQERRARLADGTD
jgi:hypothetical protein